MRNNWSLFADGALTNVVILELHTLNIGQPVGNTLPGTNFKRLAQSNDGINECRVTEQSKNL